MAERRRRLRGGPPGGKRRSFRNPVAADLPVPPPPRPVDWIEAPVRILPPLRLRRTLSCQRQKVSVTDLGDPG